MGNLSAADEPLRRGLEHEDEDYERTVQKILNQDFGDWPNEAGFEGLTEVQGPVELRVKGSIPPWAAGTLYRTGPGQYNVEDTPRGTYRTTHWFDGFGHSHRFAIIPAEDGSVRVEYTSRRQSKALVEDIRKNGRRSIISFGQRQDPCVGIFGKLMSTFRMATPIAHPELDNICVTVQGTVPGLSSATRPLESGHKAVPKTSWLGSDVAILKEVDEKTMESKTCALQTKLHPDLRGPLSCAHAQTDPETGDYFNYNLELGRVSTYRVFRSNASTGVTDILATISQSNVKPAYIHSFFLTKSYVVLCVPSTHFGAMGLWIPWELNLVDALAPFDTKNVCKWFIIDRKGDQGVTAQFETPAGFHFHSINSFEERDESTGGTDVFCDLLQYPNADIIRSYEIDVLLGNDGMTQNFWGNESKTRDALVRLVRYKFSIPKENSIEDKRSQFLKAEKLLEIKSPHVGELPTINPDYATKKYKYVYSLPNRGYSTLLDSLAKTDIETRQTLYWDNPNGHTPGEAIFVPRPKNDENGEIAEDDGVLLSVVLDGHGKKSYLVCIDAKTMKELGRAECDWAVALGFHGLHARA
ncbi:beta,beta-carotene 9',10'-dioxygenase [Truncatella angustata]|uniref:Beta,beta-carotene 9',10'-dioxygenase n=1 Tax=Truncatella angustata TaxID=152316 RepID=A0A9P8UID5_9PEZI|nr:beta,beta-carotene 9',10'-dioxygenase [Truncatella angustata]KAH6652625.1 beta,beta-carotene 9',10'-dioxygenase [Truncatella angustata]